MSTARFVTEAGGELDLLFSSSGIEPEMVAAATDLEILPGLAAPVASVGHLIALKLLSTRPERPLDQADLLALRKVATPDDLDVAAGAVALIAERGYDRGRDLATALQDLIG